MTRINAKTMLFSALILTLIIPVAGINIVEANTDTPKQLEQQMQQKSDHIKQEYAQEKSSEIIRNSEAKYYELNRAYNDLMRINPEVDYVNEWKIRDLQVMALTAETKAIQKAIDTLQEEVDTTVVPGLKAILEEEIKQLKTQIDTKKQTINTLNQEIATLEQQSIEYHKLDPQLEQKLIEMEKYVYDTYIDEEYEDFVGQNTLHRSYIDYIQKKLVVMIDNEKTDIKSNDHTLYSPALLAQKLVNDFGREYVMIEFDTIREITCDGSTPMSECRPLVGGIALATASNPTQLAGSIGYKAKMGTDIGFVTAGHVVGGLNKVMKQPVNGDNIGTSTAYEHNNGDDYAFVETTVGIDDDIFLNGDDTYEIASYATVTEHTGGTFLYKMGAKSELTWGSITGSAPAVGAYTTSIPVEGGDSGGPVFKIISGANVKLFGHLFGASPDDEGLYYSASHLVRDHGITPIT